MEEFGVIYVAFGAPYLAMALNSALSVRIFNPRLPVCVVTNVCHNPPNIAWWNMVRGSRWIFNRHATFKNREVKTNIYKYSPFEKTLYLDSDTLVLSDLSRISFFLDHFDILLKHSENPRTDAKRKLFGGPVAYSDIGHFNSGVIGFRKGAKVEQFFDLWRERYEALGFKRDQPSLVEALYYSDVRLLPLASIWNQGQGGLWWANKTTRDKVVIWHYKSRMDKNLESCLLRATGWFSEDPSDLADVKAFIGRQRKLSDHGSLKWLVKTLINEINGALSKVPESHVGREYWDRLVATSPPGAPNHDDAS